MNPPRSVDFVRPAFVAGLFYPAEPAGLRSHIASYLNAPGQDSARCAPKLAIVPHAGIVYSGVVAARAYGLLSCSRAGIRRVALIGPAHRAALRGLAAPSVGAFDTPGRPRSQTCSRNCGAGTRQ